MMSEREALSRCADQLVTQCEGNRKDPSKDRLDLIRSRSAGMG